MKSNERILRAKFEQLLGLLKESDDKTTTTTTINTNNNTTHIPNTTDDERYLTPQQTHDLRDELHTRHINYVEDVSEVAVTCPLP